MSYSLLEVVERCRVPEEKVQRFVACAWILPLDADQELFDEDDLARIRLIHELQQDFGVNEAAIPVVLHLIDQLNRIHLEITKNREQR
jgi:DNA-binding transcriptional MerR regulator